ncbi:fasciclin domain-containing protein [Arcticibacter sp.]|uniref:fasciclin domain-containing protein n=1 Tax=Arcticibacter sp. TaxID=1872630 RepID=UPI0038905DA5
MKKLLLQSLLGFFAVIMLFSNCRKSEFDEFYGRPDWLAEPIYQQLSAKRNFTNFLVCIDKAGYKDILGKAGYWTIFAPNDEAFNKYFQLRGISSVNDITDEEAVRIVKYSLVYNSFKTDHLADLQSPLGWTPASAFKRRTTFYNGVSKLNVNGQERLVISSNRNNQATATSYYVKEDNNNKYIPYFMSSFMTARGLTEYDYKYFYPSSSYTGFNVADAEVVNKDIVAENGIIHEINSVILPLPSIDEYLSLNQEYSRFKDIFDTYMVSYPLSADATAKNAEITGSTESVYVKVFDAGLSFSPNNENFMKLSDNDAQGDGFSMFAPTNAALDKYLNEVLLEHYKSLDKLPAEVLYDFLNAHMWTSTVWPSKFNSTLNNHGQGALFDPGKDIVDKKVLSNGMFYGASKVQEANVFSSVFGKAYLDPAYSLMTRALSVSLKPSIINDNLKYTLFLVSDEVITAEGFTYNIDANRWEYTPPSGGATITGTNAWAKLSRILDLHVLNDDVNSLAGSGILESNGGEYIKFENQKVYATGNQEVEVKVNVVSEKTASNGTVYYLDKLLLDPSKAVGLHLKELADQPGSTYTKFFDYLKNSVGYNQTTGEILGVGTGSLHTLFVPTNEAIDQAVIQGYLPSSNNPSSQADKEKVTNFIRYHFIQKATIVPDGKKEGGFITLLQNSRGDNTIVTITNQSNYLQIKDMTGQSVNVILSKSNNLSNRSVIHQIDGFLKFQLN